jgi:serine/threonine-protein kinase
MSIRAPLDRTGQLLRGRYRVESLMASGGQSAIYRARDEVDGDIVALKVLHPQAARDKAWVERLFREAQAMASLMRTAAVRVLDQAWTDDGCPCLVLEYLVGHDLEDHLNQIEATGARIAPKELFEVLGPIASTLHEAHAQGIIHRDLKPANIFVLDTSVGGGVRLLDFGFAKFTRARGMTEFGQVAGSPSYIAPETWRGDSSILDPRVDVYGFGAVVFRSLGRQPPFVSTNLFELANLVMQAPRPSLCALAPTLPRAMDDWVAQALAIDRENRFLTIRGAYAALGHALELG